MPGAAHISFDVVYFNSISHNFTLIFQPLPRWLEGAVENPELLRGKILTASASFIE